MAYFAKGGQYYQASGSTGGFSTTLTSNPSTVGFHLVSGTTFDKSPTLYLCPNKQYVIAVGTTGGTISTALMINTGNTNLTAPPTSLSISGLAIFTPGAGVSTLGTGFTGTLDASSDTFIVSASPTFSTVGLPSAYANPLNSCAGSMGCPCATGQTCSSSGVCTTTSPCTASSPCAGTCNGICPGANSSCLLGSNGQYNCVPNPMNKWWIWAAVIVGVIFLLLIIFLIYYGFTEKKVEPVAVYPPANNLPQQPQQMYYQTPYSVSPPGTPPPEYFNSPPPTYNPGVRYVYPAEMNIQPGFTSYAR